MTAAEKAARQAALARVKAAFNLTAQEFTDGGDALRPYSIEYRNLVIGFNDVLDAVKASRQTIIDAIEKTDAIVVGASDIGSGAAMSGASPTIIARGFYTPPGGGPAIHFEKRFEALGLTASQLDAQGIFKEPDNGSHT